MKNSFIDGAILLISALLMVTLHMLLLAIPALIIGIYLIIRGEFQTFLQQIRQKKRIPGLVIPRSRSLSA
jgi:uncharacterized membrane protein HdeD (DUF308 family)